MTIPSELAILAFSSSSSCFFFTSSASIQILSDQIKSVVVVQNDIPSSFSSRSPSIQEIDTETDNPQLVSCYVKDIYKYLLEIEVFFITNSYYRELWFTRGFILWLGTHTDQSQLHGWLQDQSFNAQHID